MGLLGDIIGFIPGSGALTGINQALENEITGNSPEQQMARYKQQLLWQTDAQAKLASDQYNYNSQLSQQQNEYNRSNMALANLYQSQQNEQTYKNQRTLTQDNALLQKRGYQQAGINQNVANGGFSSIAGASTSSSPSAPSAGLASVGQGSAGFGGSSVAPSGTTAQGIASLMNAIANAELTQSTVKKQEAETDSQLTYNQFQAHLLEMDIKLKDEECKKLYAETVKVTTECDKINKEIDRLASEIDNLDQDTQGKIIDNFYKSSVYEATIAKLQAEAHLSEAEAKAILAKLPYELGLIKAHIQEAYSNIQLNDQKFSEINYAIELCKAKTQATRYDLYLSRMFGPQRMAEEIKARQWENDPVIRYLGAFSDVVGAFRDIALTYAAARHGGKQVKTKSTEHKPVYDPKTGNVIHNTIEHYSYGD